MALDKVREYFKQFNMDSFIREFEVSSATVSLAAEALGCPPECIAKTLSFMVEDTVILIVAAGDAKIDNAKFKTVFHTKAKMLPPEHVPEQTGHPVGGVCPFAVPKNVKVYLDNSLKRFTTVFPACGSSNSAIELTLSQLEEYSNYTSWIDVCKNWSA